MRKIKEIRYSSRFEKNFKKLPIRIQQKVLKLGDVFMNDPFNHRLATHKLHGKQAGYYFFSLTYSLRIIFKFIDDKTVGFVDIGPHAIYK